ncbi:MAG: type I 3-dehydroquinate dehydratase, partial [Acidobacteria bacterium]|nr:type I 3-dehydroquinate dehydratase [Acidobacteriota bacterium]
MNDGLICISVCASTAVDLLANIRRAELQADLIEVRFDCLAKHEITSVLRSIRDAEISTPLIATYRASQQGGNNADLTRQQRLEFWRSLGDGFSYVDLEETIIGDVSVNSQIIASHHDFAMVPSDTNTIYDRLAIHEPSVIKIAAAANDICDAIPIWKLLERSRTENRNVIPLAMGEPG